MTEAERRRRFDALFREQVAGIASYCRWRASSSSDADDAVAEVFLIAWRRLDDVPFGNDARPWLFATARRVLANQGRANARRRRLSEKLSVQPFRLTEGEDEPLSCRVQDALAALHPHERELLLLAEWEGLSPAEIGRAIQRPPVTVRVRLHRARRRFRAAFQSQAASERSAPRVAPIVGSCEP